MKYAHLKKLSETHPAIHHVSQAAHFSVKQTIDREQKCASGIVRYSTSEGTVQRRVLTRHVAAKFQS